MPEQAQRDVFAPEEILFVSFFGADRFRRAVRFHLAIVDAARQLADDLTPRAEGNLEIDRSRFGEIAERAIAHCAQFLGSLRTDTPHALDRKRRKEAANVLGHDREPVGLVEIGRNLRDELARRDTGRRGELELLLDVCFDRARNGDPIAEQRLARGHIEERFIDGQPFDERRVPTKDLEDLRAHLAVAVATRLDNDRVRTLPQRFHHRHRGVRTERARLVGCCRDDAPTRPTPYEHGFSAQARVVTLLDGREERVHVHVEDLPSGQSVAERTALCVRNLAREDHHTVDQRPHGAEATREPRDGNLRDAEAGVAEVEAANAETP